MNRLQFMSQNLNYC